MRAVRTWCLAAALAVAGGCEGTEPAGCDVCTTSAVVHGRVADAAAQAVAGAAVTIEAYEATCAGPPRETFRAETGSPGAVLTDAGGTYRTRLRSPYAPFTACLRVRVSPPGGAALGEAAVEGVQLRFRNDYPDRGRDSVRVDVVLPTATRAR